MTRCLCPGVIRAKSVGFIPLRKTWNDARRGWDISEAELLEHSYVSVPANPEALVVARSKGLDRARLGAFLGSAARGLYTDADAAFLVKELRSSAFKWALGREVAVRMRRAVFASRFARVPGGAEVLELDDDVRLDPADVKRALREVLPELVAREVNRVLPPVLARARGRVD